MSTATELQHHPVTIFQRSLDFSLPFLLPYPTVFATPRRPRLPITVSWGK